MSEIILRDALLSEDRNTVRLIIERTGFFRPDEVDVAVELVDERLSCGDASGYYFVFGELENEVVGYACYGPIACTIGSLTCIGSRSDPRLQRSGIGGRLMAAVEQRIDAAGGRRIYIDTSSKAQYAPTRAFYERSRFRCEARLADFYSPGDDGVIYVTRVNG